jgi:hypothetical protein
MTHRIHASENDTALIGLIIGRAINTGLVSGQYSDALNTIALVHSTCPLDLYRLLHSSREVFTYDITGIFANVDKCHNYLERFVPRCAI